MAVLDLLVHVDNFFLNPNQWGFRLFFSKREGLQQGDPLSLYLFVLGMDILSRLINKAVEWNFLSSCKIR